MTKQIRQGDVLLVRLEDFNSEKHVPIDLTPDRVKDGKFIIAEGEKSGHMHTVDLEDVTLINSWFGGVDQEVIVVEKETQIMHDEHDPVILEPRAWAVVLQEEYDPRNQRSRVID